MEISVTNLIENYVNNLYKNNNKNLGNEMHKYFENYLKYKNEPELDSIEKKKMFLYFKNFLNFFLINNNKILYTEKKIQYTHNNKKYVGIIDAIFYNEEKDMYYIIDWKISYDISYKKKNELIYILNVYAFMFEKKLKKKIKKKLYIVLLHYNHENFIVLPIQNLKEHFINDLFN